MVLRVSFIASSSSCRHPRCEPPTGHSPRGDTQAGAEQEAGEGVDEGQEYIQGTVHAGGSLVGWECRLIVAQVIHSIATSSTEDLVTQVYRNIRCTCT